jgi:hypothetical protein
MALKLLQTSGSPLGQFDGLDTDFLTLKGGEVVTFATVAVTSGTDYAAADAFDGYISVGPKRVVVTKTLTSTTRPLMLADEGISGYGTLFGTVVGGTVGQVVYGPNSTVASSDLLGPHTARGSGKVTCWATPGLFAVTLDAVDSTPNTGITVSNPTLTAGAALYYTTAGLLTPVSTNSTKVGTFVEFTSNGSLVTTPNNLVGTLSAPDGASTTASRSFNQAVFYFNPPTA